MLARDKLSPKQTLPLVQSSYPVVHLVNALFAKAWAVAGVIGN
jgi:hypothetical protein